MRHVALLAELQSLTPDSPKWHELAGVLVCVRAFDQWIEGAPHREVASACAAARTQLQRATPQGTVVDLALRAVDELASAGRYPAGRNRVFDALLDCSREMADRGSWSPAADVCSTLLSARGVSADPSFHWRALRLRGYFGWMSGDLAAAEADYTGALAAAQRCHSAVGQARARQGLAKLLLLRGNLPAAEAGFRAVLEHGASMPASIRALAQHELAHVLFRRDQYDEGIAWLQAAVQDLEGQARERAVGDMATAYFNCGAWRTARVIYEVMIARARDPVARFMAHINLLELSAKRGDVAECDRQRAVLLAERLPPALHIERLKALSESYVSLGDRERAEEALAEFSRMSAQAGLGQFIIRAEQLLDQVRRNVPAPKSAPAPFVESGSHDEVIRLVTDALPHR